MHYSYSAYLLYKVFKRKMRYKCTEDSDVQGCDAMSPCDWRLPTFRKNAPHSTSKGLGVHEEEFSTAEDKGTTSLPNDVKG